MEPLPVTIKCVLGDVTISRHAFCDGIESVVLSDLDGDILIDMANLDRVIEVLISIKGDK